MLAPIAIRRIAVRLALTEGGGLPMAIRYGERLPQSDLLSNGNSVHFLKGKTMANLLTTHQIQSAYDVAVQVFEQSLTIKQGVDRLVGEKVGATYANDLINVYRIMRQGKCYHRAINVETTQLYLHRTYQDAGIQALTQALKATRLHIHYYEQLRKLTLRKLREVVANAELLIDHPGGTVAQYLAVSEAEVRVSSNDTSAARLARLAKKKDVVPVQFTLTATYFVRDPDVVAEALYRAGGSCEVCKKLAPFNRKSNGTPYLEVHHLVRLADGGLDNLANVAVLCPNCHRQAHFG
ncbi:5-methylcytosine-specific restriction enzyme A [Pseudomonas sp. IT-P176]